MSELYVGSHGTGKVQDAGQTVPVTGIRLVAGWRAGWALWLTLHLLEDKPQIATPEGRIGVKCVCGGGAPGPGHLTHIWLYCTLTHTLTLTPNLRVANLTILKVAGMQPPGWILHLGDLDATALQYAILGQARTGQAVSLHKYI